MPGSDAEAEEAAAEAGAAAPSGSSAPVSSPSLAAASPATAASAGFHSPQRFKTAIRSKSSGVREEAFFIKRCFLRFSFLAFLLASAMMRAARCTST